MPLLAVFGCDAGKRAAPQPASGPLLGLLELPVALRIAGGKPRSSKKVEIGPTELRVDSVATLELEHGRIAAADRGGASVPKLDDALSRGAARDQVAISAHAQVPYDTLALVLRAASRAGMRRLAFRVRKAGGAGTEGGWLHVERYQVTAYTGNEHAAIEGADPRPWSDFATRWQAVESACREAATGSCAILPERVAKGGELKIVLHASGHGTNLRFVRMGAPPPAAGTSKPTAAEVAQGYAPSSEYQTEPVATEARFQFRAKDVLTDPSPVSTTLEPVCGTTPCAVFVQSDARTSSLRVLSLIGAAFPDGTPSPTISFELPRAAHRAEAEH
ncbi:MAG: hypothetical protein MJD61_22455 [Proteobacteria bacterium]|nr:hypothetical protein [Pseudomonadota bacterium]